MHRIHTEIGVYITLAAINHMSLLHHLFQKIAIWLFVDSVWLHKYWGCHRLSDRSFFVRGRQFHICARCTGLFVGLPCSLLLLPWREESAYVFGVFAFLLVADGLTQFIRWRVSNNRLRFFTGFGTAVTFFPTLLSIGGF